jgi:hypothetical protein
LSCFQRNRFQKFTKDEKQRRADRPTDDARPDDYESRFERKRRHDRAAQSEPASDSVADRRSENAAEPERSDDPAVGFVAFAQHLTDEWAKQ